MAPVQMVIMISRKYGTTPEEFYKYWKEVHGPMFIEKVPLARKYISKYEQVCAHSWLFEPRFNPPVANQFSQYHMKDPARASTVKGMAEAGSVIVDGCDGVSVLYADSLEDLQKVFTSKEFLEIVNPDNSVYAGDVKSVVLSGEERVVMYDRMST